MTNKLQLGKNLVRLM